MTINYDYYRIFFYVAKYGSFTRAAQELYCNQPNLTRTIRNLELQLGCTLFNRSHKGVRLTEDGEKLFAHIAIAMEHIHSGEQDIFLRNNLQHGLLTIGASEIALRSYLLPLLNQFRLQYPGIRIKISNVSTPDAMDLLHDELIDLAMVTTPVNPDHDFVIQSVKTFYEVPVCGDAFLSLFQDHKAIPLRTLCMHPIVSLETNSSTYAFYQRYFGKHGLSYNPDVEAATADQLLPLIQHNLGIGFVPKDFLTQQDLSKIHILSLEEPLPARDIVLVSKPKANLSPAARELRKIILENQVDSNSECN